MLPLLNGIRVLDLSRLLPGGIATSKLADLGADVIKVEKPPVGDYLRDLPPLVEGMGLCYRMLNRNKRSIGLALGSDEGREIFLALLATADVLVESSRPGTMAEWMLDFESLRAANERLVYCSVTGYGQTGSFRELASHGMNVDAAAAMLHVRRTPRQRPEVVRASATGIHSAGTHAALAIACALVQRNRTGQGQYLDVSCWDSAVSDNHSLEVELQDPGAIHSDSSENKLLLSIMADPSAAGGLGPRYNVYGTADDKVLLLCPIERRFWVAFCKIVERPEWIDRGAWTSEMDFGEDDPALRDDIEAVMRTRTASEWMDVLMRAGVPVSPVLDVHELAHHESLEARTMVARAATGDPVAYLRPPVSIPDNEFTIALSPPQLGTHTMEVLRELGLSDERRTELVAAGIAMTAQPSDAGVSDARAGQLDGAATGGGESRS